MGTENTYGQKIKATKKKDSKITIVHYLNKTIKPLIIDNQNYYPIYIRLTAKRQVTTFKSVFDDLVFNENAEQQLFSNENSIDFKIIQLEKELITKFILQNNILENPNFKITEISKIHSTFVFNCFEMFKSTIRRKVEKYLIPFLDNHKINKRDFYSLFQTQCSNFEEMLNDKVRTFIDVFSPIIPELNSIEPMDKSEVIYNILLNNKMLHSDIYETLQEHKSLTKADLKLMSKSL